MLCGRKVTGSEVVGKSVQRSLDVSKWHACDDLQDLGWCGRASQAIASFSVTKLLCKAPGNPSTCSAGEPAIIHHQTSEQVVRFVLFRPS